MQDPHATAPPDETLRGYYHLHFAGRPRLTRNGALLRELIDMATRAQNVTLATQWRAELQAIENEQAAAGVPGRQLAQRMERCQMLSCRLRRLVLDASRYHGAAIDVEAMTELLRDAETLAAAIAHDVAQGGAQNLLQTLDGILSEGQRLRSAAQARCAEGPAALRAQACVRAAQLLQHTFDTRVAHQPGTIVRAERVTMLADGLQRVAAHLQACAIDGPDHAANCRALQEQADAWRAEAQRARALRRQHSPDELAHALAAAADSVLEAADQVGQSDHGVSGATTQMIALCDRMDEIGRQLDGMPLIFGLAHHHNTLSTVYDGLAYLSARLDGMSDGPSVHLSA